MKPLFFFGFLLLVSYQIQGQEELYTFEDGQQVYFEFFEDKSREPISMGLSAYTTVSVYSSLRSISDFIQGPRTILGLEGFYQLHNDFQVKAHFASGSLFETSDDAYTTMRMGLNGHWAIFRNTKDYDEGIPVGSRDIDINRWVNYQIIAPVTRSYLWEFSLGINQWQHFYEDEFNRDELSNLPRGNSLRGIAVKGFDITHLEVGFSRRILERSYFSIDGRNRSHVVDQRYSFLLLLPLRSRISGEYLFDDINLEPLPFDDGDHFDFLQRRWGLAFNFEYNSSLLAQGGYLAIGFIGGLHWYPIFRGSPALLNAGIKLSLIRNKR